jgi:hypothetical protein
MPFLSDAYLTARTGILAQTMASHDALHAGKGMPPWQGLRRCPSHPLIMLKAMPQFFDLAAKGM